MKKRDLLPYVGLAFSLWIIIVAYMHIYYDLILPWLNNSQLMGCVI